MEASFGFLSGKEDPMSQIAWQTDVDAALERARAENKPVLLDFSAAPM
jgi:uncharacterized protein YyaL (SSP411 family)